MRASLAPTCGYGVRVLDRLLPAPRGDVRAAIGRMFWDGPPSRSSRAERRFGASRRS